MIYDEPTPTRAEQFAERIAPPEPYLWLWRCNAVATESSHPVGGKDMRTSRSVQRWIGLTTAAVATTALVTVPASSAQADVGDGNLACSVGEICFKKHRDSNWEQYLKHFWYNDLNHDNNYFSGNGGVVGENASMYWNRDTECGVYVKDYVPVFGNWTYFYMSKGGTTWYAYFGDSWNDENDGHERCSYT